MNEITLKFELNVKCEKEYADELGEDLAIFLMESFFNGEDYLQVNYTGHDTNGNKSN